MLKSWLLLFALALSSGIVQADEAIDNLAPDDTVNQFKELDVPLPAFPEDGNLIPFLIDDRGTGYTYKMDSKALSVGDDGVTRYTVVVESPTGAKNVFYEGVRCETEEYKTYAYGTSSGGFQKAYQPTWRRMFKAGPRNYHSDLTRNFLCDRDGFNYRVDIVQDRLRYFDGYSSDVAF